MHYINVMYQSDMLDLCIFMSSVCGRSRLKVNICKKFNLMLKQIEKYKLDTLNYQFSDPTYTYTF